MSEAPLTSEVVLPLAVLRSIDQVCDRFEAGWQSGQRPRIEECLLFAQGPARSELLCELLRVELDYRARCGERPQAGEYLQRFPQFTAAVSSVFADATQRSSLATDTVRLSSAGVDTDEHEIILAAAPAPAARSAEAVPIVPGYEVIEVLGTGGMGVVYKARQVGLNRIVALKMIRAELSGQLRERFQAEARAIALLDHPNIVRVFEYGEVGGQPYFALEYVPGGDLGRWRNNRPPTPRASARIVTQLADAVDYAHRMGVIHRDLKPANVLLSSSKGEEVGIPKIADFGLCKHETGEDSGLSLPGDRLGTPAYMPPEQAAGRGDSSGPSSDIFGLGGILYELLTGQPPFRGTSNTEAMDQARRGRIAPLRRPGRTIPASLERICLRALASNPKARYACAADLAYDLRSFLAWPKRMALTAAGIAALLMLGMVGWVIQSNTRPTVPSSNPIANSTLPTDAAPAVPLSGELIVKLWSKDKTKLGLPVDQPGALPARPDEHARVEVRLNQPAYIYLLWLDTQGEVTPLYPWNAVKIENDLTLLPPEKQPVASIISPTAADSRDDSQGWPIDDQSGLETVLLLARRTPLPASVKLTELVGPPSPTRLRHQSELALRGFDNGQPVDFIDMGQNRGIKKEAEQIDDPLLQLMGRLRQHFETFRAVRFAHQGN